jgi:hypothetical protein
MLCITAKQLLLKQAAIIKQLQLDLRKVSPHWREDEAVMQHYAALRQKSSQKK